MSLFSGLDKLGLGKLEKMDVFEGKKKRRLQMESLRSQR